MPQLLLELFSEEIPARMQKKAAADLERMMMDALTKAGLLPGTTKAFSAPRRLTLVIEDLAARTPDVSEERKGPKVDAPQQAIDGFLRGAGLASLDQARVMSDPKKGDFYVADLKRSGQATTDQVAAIVPDIIASFPWPKSMRWGEGSLRWVRPLHKIVCVFDGEIVPFEVGGIASGNVTEGHRFHGTGSFAVRDFDDYAEKLAKAKVVLDRDERKAMLLTDARMLCAAQNLELVEDEGLAEEVTGLVDFPVVLLGRMDPAFLDLPPEVIKLTLRINQKYFVVRDPATGKLAPHFIVVSNVAATDGGAKIAAGNARVLSARLNDARHFWDLDRKTPLGDRVAKLDTLVFHEKLGSVSDKVRRIVALAGEIAPLVGADVELARRAALLAKADLTTGMVGEFPELQGVMGRYYAQLQDEHPSVADAIRDHYKPQGPSDAVPTDPVGMAVALADKIDTLTGFFAIGEKPTGSGDPYALRRAALGVLRILRIHSISINALEAIIAAHISLIRTWNSIFSIFTPDGDDNSEQLVLTEPVFVANGGLEQRAWVLFTEHRGPEDDEFATLGQTPGLEPIITTSQLVEQLVPFILDRLRIMLRDEGFAPDVLEAAFAVPDDDINRIVARVTALAGFVKTTDGANLAAGYKRAANILASETRKAPLPEGLAINESLLVLHEEKALAGALGTLSDTLPGLLEKEDFESAMRALSNLRAPVDAFFDAVLVNDPDAAIRLNRLALLSAVTTSTTRIADLSRLSG